MTRISKICATVALIGLFPSTGIAQGDAELAQQLANPAAAVYTIPFQLNYDDNFGPNDEGHRTTLNIQPVIPFSLDNGANIITRTIMPFIWQDDVIPGTSQEGMGDVIFTAWYSETASSNLTWGFGPVVQIPTGSSVSSDTWAAGISGIALKVDGPWTYGGLFNHLWDIEDNPNLDISTTFMQPFVSYSTPSAWTYTVTSETTYDWINDQWQIPVNFNISKLAPIGNVPVNWVAGVGYWAESAENGPEGWRARLMAQIVIPKK